MLGVYFEEYEQAQQEALKSIDEYAHAAESGTPDDLRFVFISLTDCCR